MGKTKQITKDLVVKLTSEEKAELADQLTERISRKDYLEDAKRVMAKKYAAQIEETVAEINDISMKIRSGEELRPVACEIRYDDPVPGYKTTYRIDTGAKIGSELMTEADLQGELFPEDGEEADGEAPETDAESAPEGETDGEPEAETETAEPETEVESEK